jgi:hypothetical protein
VPVSASAASGKEARQRISRSAQAGWEPGPDRTGPVETLAEQDKSRVPELVPVRYGRMLASAFTFYRGAAGIMAADLGAGPDSGLRVQLCGDAHLSNFPRPRLQEGRAPRRGARLGQRLPHGDGPVQRDE